MPISPVDLTPNQHGQLRPADFRRAGQELAGSRQINLPIGALQTAAGVLFPNAVFNLFAFSGGARVCGGTVNLTADNIWTNLPLGTVGGSVTMGATTTQGANYDTNSYANGTTFTMPLAGYFKANVSVNGWLPNVAPMTPSGQSLLAWVLNATTSSGLLNTGKVVGLSQISTLFQFTNPSQPILIGNFGECYAEFKASIGDVLSLWVLSSQNHLSATDYAEYDVLIASITFQGQ